MSVPLRPGPAWSVPPWRRRISRAGPENGVRVWGLWFQPVLPAEFRIQALTFPKRPAEGLLTS